MDRIHNLLNDVQESLSAQKTYDGKKRSELKDSDFLFPETRSFPIVSPTDVQDAINNYGRMSGDMSYDVFLRKLYDLCKRKGPEFVAALPKASKEKLGIKSTKSCMQNQDRFAVGDSVENINTSCIHYGSKGIVEDLENLPHNMGHVIVYKTTNMGPTWNKDQILKKTPSQLVKASIQMQQHREPSMTIDDQTNTNDITSENIDEPTVINQPTNINEPMDNADLQTNPDDTALDQYKDEFLEMVISALKAVTIQASSILEQINDPSVSENLTEPWLQSKITLIRDYMSTVHDFVMFYDSEDDSEETEAARKEIDRHRKHHHKEKPTTKISYRVLPALITHINPSHDEHHTEEPHEEPNENQQPTNNTDDAPSDPPSAPSSPAAPASEKPGLWENIRKKKQREGKKYKPAKRGDPDRPSPEQWKKLTK